MGKCIHQLFAERVLESPDSIAVCAGSERITYRELDERASKLAGVLRELAVRPDVLVGLCIDRSSELIIGMLAILKAGGAYVPIDPDYPETRVQFLVADSQIAVVVTVLRLADRFCDAKVQVICVDTTPADETPIAEPSEVPHDGNLAYVIYTSGTTGQPKGVMIEHRNVARLFARTEPWFSFSSTDVWTMFHSPSFDFSVWEIWGALLYGGQLVIVPLSIAKSPADFGRLLQRERVTVLNQTPSAFRQFIQWERQCVEPLELSLRLVIFGGEKLDFTILASWFLRHGDARPELINMYGITETTVHVTYKRLTEEMSHHSGLSLIGEPISDLRLCLLDPAGREVAADLPGEIHVAGPGVARGYLNRPTLTAERFIDWTDASGAAVRMYRSGDLALRRGDGELVYLGRSDDQLKVRGFRVEPAEIEACLLTHSAVVQAQVLVRDFGEGDLRLMAFVVIAPDRNDDPPKLLQVLRRKAEHELPAHMCPSQIVLIDAVPLTAHGKVDKQALLLWVKELERRDAVRAESLPRGMGENIEAQIGEIVTRILEQPRVQVRDDLGALGLTSLALVRILLQLNRQFGVSLTGSEMGEPISIAALASQVSQDLRGK